MTQEVFWVWFFGFFCGVLVFNAIGMVNSMKFWSLVFDAYYWLKDKIRR